MGTCHTLTGIYRETSRLLSKHISAYSQRFDPNKCLLQAMHFQNHLLPAIPIRESEALKRSIAYKVQTEQPKYFFRSVDKRIGRKMKLPIDHSDNEILFQRPIYGQTNLQAITSIRTHATLPPVWQRVWTSRSPLAVLDHSTLLQQAVYGHWLLC